MNILFKWEINNSGTHQITEGKCENTFPKAILSIAFKSKFFNCSGIFMNESPNYILNIKYLEGI